jgi:integrase/recombinase XerC
VQTAHIRRWVAQMHGAGRSGRGIALILSGWRGFYAWLGAGPGAQQSGAGRARAQVAKPLPKALGVDDAVQLADHERGRRRPGAGGARRRHRRTALRLRPARGRTGGPGRGGQRTAKGWLDLQAGEAHVLGKGSKRRSVPVGRQAAEALRHWLALRAAGRATTRRCSSAAAARA